MDWDDYKFFSTIASTRSVRSAAEVLGVNPSTVSRRLENFEDRLGVPLFTRSQRGLTITPEGAEVIAQVDKVASDLSNIEGMLAGKDQRLSGQIRVVIPEVIALSLLVREIDRFMEEYPDIQVELIPSHQKMNIMNRDADILIEATDHPSENLIGRSLSPIAIAAYCSTDLHLTNGEKKIVPQTAGAYWIEFDTDSEMSRESKKLRKIHAPDAKIRVKTHSLLLHLEAVKQHLGYGFLPCILAESDSSLRRVPGIPAILGPSMWMLTHPDLRAAKRVRVFMEFVRDIFNRRSDELLGEEFRSSSPLHDES